MPIEKLSDTGRYIMELLWEQPMQAKDVVARMTERYSYKRGTTYKLLERLLEKGFVYKEEDVYFPVYSREEIVKNETQSFLDRFFNGSFSKLAVQFMQNEKLSEQDIDEIKKIINKYD